MKTFVIHYNKLVERKARLMPLMAINHLQCQFVDKYDRDTLGEAEINMFKWRWPFRFMLSQKDKASMAITLSHIYSWREIAEQHELGLILEDDAIFDANFRPTLDDYLSQLPSGWDMLFIGDGCNLHIPESELTPGRFIYEKSHGPTKWGGRGATRCTDSYIMSQKAAQKISDFIQSAGAAYKITQNVDWWLNEVISACELKIYWSEPTIVTQGSQNKLYKTSWR